MNSGEDKLYMKIVAFVEIYNVIFLLNYKIVDLDESYNFHIKFRVKCTAGRRTF
jgi:hypothetical protein